MASNLISTTTRHLNVVLRTAIKRTIPTTTTTTVRKCTTEPPASDAPAAAPTTDIPQDQAAYDAYIASYKNQGYYSHGEYSYFDLEHQMAPDRIEQPSCE